MDFLEDFLNQTHCFLCSLSQQASQVKVSSFGAVQNVQTVCVLEFPFSDEKSQFLASYRGKILSSILRSLGIYESQYRVIYTTRCLVPKKEIKHIHTQCCLSYSRAELSLYKPDQLIFFGVDAYNQWFGTSHSLSEIRGLVHKVTIPYTQIECMCVVTYPIETVIAYAKKRSLIESDISYLKNFKNKSSETQFNKLLHSLDEIKAVLSSIKERYLKGEIKFISFDLETSSLDAFSEDSHILGCSVGVSEHEIYFVPFRRSSHLFISETDVAECVLDLIYHVPLVCHNGKFDMRFMKSQFLSLCEKFEQKGLSVRLYFDTMLASYLLLSTNHSLSLKELSKKFLGVYPIETYKEIKKSKFDFDKIDMVKISEYAIADAKATLQLFFILNEKIKDEGLQELLRFMMRLSEMFVDIEINGIYIDKNIFSDIYQKTVEKKEFLKKFITSHFFYKLFCSGLYKTLYTSKLKYKKYSFAVKEPVELLKDKPSSDDSVKGISFVSFKYKISDSFFEHKEKGQHQLKIVEAMVFDCAGLQNTDVSHHSSNETEETIKDSDKKSAQVDLKTLQRLKKYVLYLLQKKSDLSESDIYVLRQQETECENIAKFYENLERQYSSFFVFYYYYLSYLESVITFRKTEILINNYLSKITKYIHNGFIHSHFSLTSSLTGRISSSSPNLQTIPNLEDLRKSFVSRFSDGVIVVADMSQLELRVLASVLFNRYQDNTLVSMFKSGEDLHKKLASYLFKKEVSDVSDQERQYAKSVVYGIIYGQSESSLKKNLMLDEVSEIYNVVFQHIPSLKQYIEDQHQLLSRKVPIRTYFNRIMTMNDSTVSQHYAKSQRQAINLLIQSLGSDLFHHAVLNIYEFLKKTNKKTKIVNVVHDSIVLDCFRDELKEVTEMVSYSTSQYLQEKFDWVTCPMQSTIKIEEKNLTFA